VNILSSDVVTSAIAQAAPGEPAQFTSDDIGLIWLKNSSNTNAVRIDKRMCSG
jgi:hypothetical protein